MDHREKQAAPRLNLPHPPHPDKIVFIHLLRAAAVLLVLWAHLGGWWLSASGTSSAIQTKWIDYICRPFRLYQDGGHLGVLLFFLVSGFVITHVSLKESRFEFALKRIFRLTPALAIALATLPAIAYLSQRMDIPPTMGNESNDYIRGFF
jgi:peptidoglycan/LPS O-acetylase OafA/YrhL